MTTDPDAPATLSNSDVSEQRAASSPADTFAPMVEAALMTYLTMLAWDGLDQKAAMRRALAAAIENAPYTYAVKKVRTNSGAMTYEIEWRELMTALAAELRGKP